jgi:hypothetical protein
MWGARGGRGISMVRGKGGERRVAAGELRLLLPGRHAQQSSRSPVLVSSQGRRPPQPGPV